MSDIAERFVAPMSAEKITKLKEAVEKRWDGKPHYPGGGGILSPGCMLRAEEVLGLIASIEQLERENASLREQVDKAKILLDAAVITAEYAGKQTSTDHIGDEWLTPQAQRALNWLRAARTWMEKSR